MMKMQKMLIAGVSVLALSPVISTTVASTTVYAESQKQEEVLQEKNLDDGKKYELIQEDDGSVSFQKRTKADKWGNIELTEWRTI